MPSTSWNHVQRACRSAGLDSGHSGPLDHYQAYQVLLMARYSGSYSLNARLAIEHLSWPTIRLLHTFDTEGEV